MEIFLLPIIYYSATVVWPSKSAQRPHLWNREQKFLQVGCDTRSRKYALPGVVYLHPTRKSLADAKFIHHNPHSVHIFHHLAQKKRDRNNRPDSVIGDQLSKRSNANLINARMQILNIVQERDQFIDESKFEMISRLRKITKEKDSAFGQQQMGGIIGWRLVDLHGNDEEDVEEEEEAQNIRAGTILPTTDQEETAASVDEPVRCAARRRPTLIGHLATETGPFAARKKPAAPKYEFSRTRPANRIFPPPTKAQRTHTTGSTNSLRDRPLDKTTESIDHPGPREPHTLPVKRLDCDKLLLFTTTTTTTTNASI
ncbi:hypothetical protein T11_15399 [Trichinella zimbabwensis]|uniref:Uncharacterized protein n=1 Tax=Trichinella zimbabwensis TaxID=268475 RepID=A0A0V1H472_9BILA|nr:hypothetical protein T11_15399 [Trichinella zimbabwensis]